MASIQPNIAHSFTVRAEYANEIGMLAQITSVIGFAGGDLGAMDIADAAREQPPLLPPPTSLLALSLLDESCSSSRTATWSCAPWSS